MIIKTMEQAMNRLKELDELYFKSNKDQQGLIKLEMLIILHRIAMKEYME